MKFYVASSIRNIDQVRYVSEKLKDKGYIHTYDWTQNERASTFKELEEISQNEKNAVMEADFIIVLLPAGKGSHIELGIALGKGIKIYLYSPDEEVNNIATTSTFYHLSEVEKCFGTIDDLIEVVAINERVNNKNII